jgi:hypothetical protein
VLCVAAVALQPVGIFQFGYLAGWQPSKQTKKIRTKSHRHVRITSSVLFIIDSHSLAPSPPPTTQPPPLVTLCSF